MKPAREKAAEEIAALASDIIGGGSSVGANIVREQQLAFGRRVLEHVRQRIHPFGDVPESVVREIQDSSELEKLLDEEGA